MSTCSDLSNFRVFNVVFYTYNYLRCFKLSRFLTLICELNPIMILIIFTICLYYLYIQHSRSHICKYGEGKTVILTQI